MRAKGDHSKKVGGRRNAGPMAKKSSMAKRPKGEPVVRPGGAKSYHKR